MVVYSALVLCELLMSMSHHRLLSVEADERKPTSLVLFRRSCWLGKGMGDMLLWAPFDWAGSFSERDDDTIIIYHW